MGCDISAAWADLGRKEGLAAGRQEGQEEMSRLISAMVADGQFEELEQSAKNREFREKMLREYHLI